MTSSAPCNDLKRNQLNNVQSEHDLKLQICQSKLHSIQREICQSKLDTKAIESSKQATQSRIKQENEVKLISVLFEEETAKLKLLIKAEAQSWQEAKSWKEAQAQLLKEAQTVTNQINLLAAQLIAKVQNIESMYYQ